MTNTHTKKKVEGSQRQGYPSYKLYVSGHWAADKNAEANRSCFHGVHTCREQQLFASCGLKGPREPQQRQREGEEKRRRGEEEVTDASPPRLGLEHGYITLRLCWPQLPTREWLSLTAPLQPLKLRRDALC